MRQLLGHSSAHWRGGASFLKIAAASGYLLGAVFLFWVAGLVISGKVTKPGFLAASSPVQVENCD